MTEREYLKGILKGLRDAMSDVGLIDIGFRQPPVPERVRAAIEAAATYFELRLQDIRKAEKAAT